MRVRYHDLSTGLDLQKTQSLVIIPQLQQAIKLLQLSNLELSFYFHKALEGNPLLQRDETSEAALVCDLTEDQLRTERERKVCLIALVVKRKRLLA